MCWRGKAMISRPDRSLRDVAKGLQRAERTVSREGHAVAAILRIEPAKRVGQPGNRPCPKRCLLAIHGPVRKIVAVDILLFLK
jgi:hypothetical protein